MRYLLAFKFFLFFLFLCDNSTAHYNDNANIKLCKDLPYEEALFLENKNFGEFSLELIINQEKKWVKNNLKDAVSAKKVNNTFTSKKRVQATLIVNNNKNIKCVLNVTIRAHGDTAVHHEGEGLPSLNINIKDGNVFGITQFILFKPLSRNGFSEIFVTSLLENLNLLGPRSSKVRLKYNLYEQEFLFQEKINKEFLENNKKREGPILEGDERFIFKEGDAVKNQINFVNHRISNSSWIKEDLNKKIISEISLSLLNKHGQLLQMDVPKSWVIDYYSVSKLLGTEEYFSKIPVYDALMFAVGGIPNLSLQDRRFYFNAMERKFEPIFYNGNPEIFDKNDHLLTHKLKDTSNLEIIDIEKYGQKFYLPDLARGKVLKSSVVGAKEAIDIMNNLDLDNLYQKIIIRGFRINKDEFNKIISTVKERLNLLKEFKEDRIFKTELNLSKIEANNDFRPKSTVKDRSLLFYNENFNGFYICDIYKSNCQNLNLNNKQIKDALSQNLIVNGNKVVFIGKNISNNTLEDWIYSFYKNSVSSQNHKAIYSSEDFDLYMIGNANETIEVDPDKKKISLMKSDKDTRFIINGKRISNWEISMYDKSYYDLSKEIEHEIDSNNITGCLNFKNIFIENIKITVDGAKCEDAINFIASDGTILETKITNSRADAIDSDFSNLKFKNLFIENAGNDCLDISYGNYEFENTIVKKCNDKGFSVGERSVANIKNSFIEFSKIGVASKDSSKVYIEKSIINNVKDCYAAYNKKKEFYGSLLKTFKNTCKNYSKINEELSNNSIIVNKD